jgi:hypothetical protein
MISRATESGWVVCVCGGGGGAHRYEAIHVHTVVALVAEQQQVVLSRLFAHHAHLALEAQPVGVCLAPSEKVL